MADFGKAAINFLVIYLCFIVSGCFALFLAIVFALLWVTGTINVGLLRLQGNQAMPTIVVVKMEPCSSLKR